MCRLTAANSSGPGSLQSVGNCLANDAPAYSETASRTLAQLSPERLVEHRFAIFSHIYNSMPANGYPIRFMQDGSIVGAAYDGYQWSITKNSLRISSPEGGSVDVFSSDRECVSLTSMPKERANPMLQTELAIVVSPGSPTY